MKFVAKRDSRSVVVPGHNFLFNWFKPFISGKKVLDIGCWSGPLEELMKDENCEVVGIDIEDAPLKVAQKKYPMFKFLNHSIAEEIPKKIGPFDVVLYFMVIEHIPKGSELSSLININKSMKKNGLLFMNTMNDTFLSNLLDPAYFFGHRHYKKKNLTRMLKKAGFKIEEIHYNAGFYTTGHMLMLYFFKHVLRRKEPRSRFFDSLMKRDYRNKGFAEIDILARKVATV